MRKLEANFYVDEHKFPVGLRLQLAQLSLSLNGIVRRSPEAQLETFVGSFSLLALINNYFPGYFL